MLELPVRFGNVAGLLGVVRTQGMTLSALGLIGGEKVMVEHKNPDGKWPRRKYIESPGFRQFRENDRVDAMDYQGRWFRGQVGFAFVARGVLPTPHTWVLGVLPDRLAPRARALKRHNRARCASC